jgi:hypothetical protein
VISQTVGDLWERRESEKNDGVRPDEEGGIVWDIDGARSTRVIGTARMRECGEVK